MSPAALASDKVLCAQIKLQHILEEFEAQSTFNTGPTAVEITHRVAKRQLSDWATTLHIWNDSLKWSQQFVTLYVHELAMTATTLVDQPPAIRENAVLVSSSEFSDCLAATRNSLDLFLSLDMPFIRTLPTSYFVQLTHTALVLVKFHFAAARLSSHAAAARKILDIRAEAFLERLLAKCSGWGTLWPAQRLARILRKLRELLRQCGDQRLASDLTWLDVWTLEEVPSIELINKHGCAPEQSEYIEQDEAIFQDQGIAERATLSTLTEDVPAWPESNTDLNNDMQNVARSTLPSASLDATQLIDWFGTDLNTSTFDFDGNLQSIVQFFG
ncbi:hypothetical protein QM012_003533 [Aureobasidium pullulans]|uniref:Transcription factor domain-containing protein n=1 Tax=Aureobasidium pullulans TaxID=5580 RepID=A0ABR0T8P4_AURPU